MTKSIQLLVLLTFAAIFFAAGQVKAEGPTPLFVSQKFVRGPVVAKLSQTRLSQFAINNRELVKLIGFSVYKKTKSVMTLAYSAKH